jgi:hypothetical protein
MEDSYTEGLYCSFPEHDEIANSICTRLRDIGFVQGESPTWRLTKLGASSIQYGMPLKCLGETSRPRAANVPLKDMTQFEKLLRLEHEGWTWKKLPRKAEDRTPYTVGGDKIFYTSGFEPLPSYLSALLSATDLNQPIEHGKPSKYYSELATPGLNTGCKVVVFYLVWLRVFHVIWADSTT